MFFQKTTQKILPFVLAATMVVGVSAMNFSVINANAATNNVSVININSETKYKDGLPYHEFQVDGENHGVYQKPLDMYIGETISVEKWCIFIDGNFYRIANWKPSVDELNVIKNVFAAKSVTTELFIPKKILYYNNKQFKVELVNNRVFINAIAATSSKTPGNIKVQFVSKSNHTLIDTIQIYAKPHTHTYKWAQLSKGKSDTMYIGDKGCIILGDSSGNGKGATTKIVSVTSTINNLRI